MYKLQPAKGLFWLLNKKEYKSRISNSYEDKLKFDNSAWTVKPDFTIENLITDRKFYWEHLGMMTKTDYREKFVLHTKAKMTVKKVLI